MANMGNDEFTCKTYDFFLPLHVLHPGSVSALLVTSKGLPTTNLSHAACFTLVGSVQAHMRRIKIPKLRQGKHRDTLQEYHYQFVTMNWRRCRFHEDMWPFMRITNSRLTVPRIIVLRLRALRDDWHLQLWIGIEPEVNIFSFASDGDYVRSSGLRHKLIMPIDLPFSSRACCFSSHRSQKQARS
jgi:hypothetical protein